MPYIHSTANMWLESMCVLCDNAERQQCSKSQHEPNAASKPRLRCLKGGHARQRARLLVRCPKHQLPGPQASPGWPEALVL